MLIADGGGGTIVIPDLIPDNIISPQPPPVLESSIYQPIPFEPISKVNAFNIVETMRYVDIMSMEERIDAGAFASLAILEDMSLTFVAEEEDVYTVGDVKLLGSEWTFAEQRYISYVKGAYIKLGIPLEVFLWYDRKYSGFTEEELENMFDVDIKWYHKLYADIFGAIRTFKSKYAILFPILIVVGVILGIYLLYKFLTSIVMAKGEKIGKKKIKFTKLKKVL